MNRRDQFKTGLRSPVLLLRTDRHVGGESRSEVLDSSVFDGGFASQQVRAQKPDLRFAGQSQFENQAGLVQWIARQVAAKIAGEAAGEAQAQADSRSGLGRLSR